ncbi:MAG: hypothetical protein ACE366_16470 [Bradymonadia bacterium]
MATPHRIFGPSVQAAVSRLRRSSIMALSELGSPESCDDVPVTVDIIRRELTQTGSSALGIVDAHTHVSGLNNIPALIRMSGTWRDQTGGGKRQLLEAERIVVLLDIPVAGNAGRGELLPTDRLKWSEPPYGERTFEVVEITIREADQAVVALVREVKS